jgi:hypothetical protein
MNVQPFVLPAASSRRTAVHAFDPAGSSALFYGICPSRILPAGPGLIQCLGVKILQLLIINTIIDL